MKNLKLTFVLMLVSSLALSVTACSNTKKSASAEVNHQDHSMHDHGAAATSTVAADISKAQAKKALAAYLDVKAALVETNASGAAQAAGNMVAALREAKGELAEKLRFDAQHISETEDVGHQREHFKALSENVYTMTVASAANGTEIYRQYCPMALDNTGAYWLSQEKEVNNPYFGDMMLHCGSVKETLKANK